MWRFSSDRKAGSRSIFFFLKAQCTATFDGRVDRFLHIAVMAPDVFVAKIQASHRQVGFAMLTLRIGRIHRMPY
jgi:hypothetical protein